MGARALRVMGLAGIVVLATTGCGDLGGTATSTVTVTETVTATPTEPAVPILEAGQSDQDLAFEFVDALNTWFGAGQEDLEQRLPVDATPEQIAQTSLEIAEEHREEFSDALLTDDFDSRSPDFGTFLDTDLLLEFHASELNRSIDGHKEFSLDDQTGIVLSGEPIESFKTTLVVARHIDSQENGVIWIKVNRITDPDRKDLVTPDVKMMTVVFEEQDGIVKLASMQW